MTSTGQGVDGNETRASWDSAAPAFDDQADHGLTDARTRAAWWTVLAGLLPAPPARVADLGCGTGSVSVLMAEHGHHVTGIDFSTAMVERAVRKARASEVRVCLAVGDASDPPLRRAAWDVVFARHVVWAVPDPAACLKRWTRLLGPEGRLVLVEGRWSTGAGLVSQALRELAEPMSTRIDLVDLSDPRLWGRQITDERYALVVWPARAPGAS